jgi:hypothetical protein
VRARAERPGVKGPDEKQHPPAWTGVRLREMGHWPRARTHAWVDCRKAPGDEQLHESCHKVRDWRSGVDGAEEQVGDIDAGHALRFFSPVHGAFRGAVIGPPFTAGTELLAVRLQPLDARWLKPERREAP